MIARNSSLLLFCNGFNIVACCLYILYKLFYFYCSRQFCLQCFDAVGWVAERTSEWWGAGMVICLERDADLHMAQLMSLPLAVSCFSKIQIGFTFLVPARPGSPGKGPLNGCVCVCV